MTVVRNHSDLSPAMRKAVLSIDSGEVNCATSTRHALARRGLITATAGGLELTEAGRQVAKFARSAMDNEPIVSVECTFQTRTNPACGYYHAPGEDCPNESEHVWQYTYALGYLESAVGVFLRRCDDRDDDPRALSDLRAAYERVQARCPRTV